MFYLMPVAFVALLGTESGVEPSDFRDVSDPDEGVFGRRGAKSIVADRRGFSRFLLGRGIGRIAGVVGPGAAVAHAEKAVAAPVAFEVGRCARCGAQRANVCEKMHFVRGRTVGLVSVGNVGRAAASAADFDFRVHRVFPRDMKLAHGVARNTQWPAGKVCLLFEWVVSHEFIMNEVGTWCSAFSTLAIIHLALVLALRVRGLRLRVN